MTSFRLIEKVGEGSYSKVYRATSQNSNKTLAVKIIRFEDAPKQFLLSREIKILKECQHPNIAALLDCIFTQDAAYLVFQYYPMNLAQFYRHYQNTYRRALGEQQIAHIMGQICSALAYLHAKGVMHRDVKPENVMINGLTLQVKLIDFGFAREIGTPLTQYTVTRWYRPLQIAIGLSYDEKVDVFSVAAVYIELMHSREIFQSTSNLEQLSLLLKTSGYPSEGSRQWIALQKLGIANEFPEPTLPKLLQGVRDTTKEILTQMLSNCSEERPKITRMLENLSSICAPTRIVRFNSEDSRNRARSSASGMGITVVSIGKCMKERGMSRQPRNLVRAFQ